MWWVAGWACGRCGACDSDVSFAVGMVFSIWYERAFLRCFFNITIFRRGLAYCLAFYGLSLCGRCAFS